MDNIDRELDSIFGNTGGAPSPEAMQGLVMMIANGGMMGSPMITGDEIEYHEGNKLVLPKGMTFEQAMRVLRRLREEAETVTNFTRRYDFRPDDGAVATSRVLSSRYGMVLGESIDMGFFGGIRPPEQKTVKIGPDEKVQVPWGRISIPTLQDVSLTLCADYDDDRGELFHLHVEAAKKHKAEIDALFSAIEEELKSNSIYRGKALSGSNRLEFMDLTSFNADEIVFSDQVTAELEAGVWAVLRYTDAFRQEGLKTKRTALLYGPYGTGKSSAGLITAQVAVENGWTFLSAKPGEDDVEDVLTTAKLYQPAVVFIEDIDTQASSSDDDEISKLLEAFDGITAKGGELVIVMTTNHRDRIHRGMFRPGRLDAIIEVNSLDRNSIERLVRAIVPQSKLSSTIDFEQVYISMEGFYPAFVREALERAKTFAISRGKGVRNYTLDTEDIVTAANSLRPQLDVLNQANEGESKPDLVQALTTTVKEAAQEAVHGTHLRSGVLSVPALNGQRR